jgi:hypothetical protein
MTTTLEKAWEIIVEHTRPTGGPIRVLDDPEALAIDIAATFDAIAQGSALSLLDELDASKARIAEVKPLKWKRYEKDVKQFAHTDTGVMFCLYLDYDLWHLERRDGGVTHSVWDTEDEAKEFAQTKWSELVLSALAPPPHGDAK